MSGIPPFRRPVKETAMNDVDENPPVVEAEEGTNFWDKAGVVAIVATVLAIAVLVLASKLF